MIKRCSKEDIHHLLRLEQAYMQMPYSERILSDLIDNERVDILKYEFEGEVVGYVSIETVIDEGNINNVVVDKRFRGRGIGEELMRKAIDLSVARGATRILLEVNVDNVAAIALYNKLGFIRISIRKNYYGSDDAFIYELNM